MTKLQEKLVSVKREPLSEALIWEFYCDARKQSERGWEYFARQIEQAHGISNGDLGWRMPYKNGQAHDGMDTFIATLKPLSDEQIDDIQERAYGELRAKGFTGSMGGLAWDRASARAIERAHGIGVLDDQPSPIKRPTSTGPLSKSSMGHLIAQATGKRINLRQCEIEEALHLVSLVEQAHGIGDDQAMVPKTPKMARIKAETRAGSGVDHGTENELPSYQRESPREKALNALLWFYRRFKPTYGRLPFAEEAIALLHRGADSVVEIPSAPQWLPIESAPTEDFKPFLVLLPGNDVAAYVVLQVSRFEGHMYPDHLGGLIDWGDRVTNASQWTPVPPWPAYTRNELQGDM